MHGEMFDPRYELSNDRTMARLTLMLLSVAAMISSAMLALAVIESA